MYQEKIRVLQYWWRKLYHFSINIIKLHQKKMYLNEDNVYAKFSVLCMCVLKLLAK